MDPISPCYNYKSSNVKYDDCSSASLTTSKCSFEYEPSSSSKSFANIVLSANQTANNNIRKLCNLTLLISNQELERPNLINPICNDGSFYKQLFDDDSDLDCAKYNNEEENLKADYIDKSNSLSHKEVVIDNIISLTYPKSSHIVTNQSTTPHSIEHTYKSSSLAHNLKFNNKKYFLENFKQQPPQQPLFNEISNRFNQDILKKRSLENSIIAQSHINMNTGKFSGSKLSFAAVKYNALADSICFLEWKIKFKVNITNFDYEAFLRGKILKLASSKDNSKILQKAIYILLAEPINAILNEIFYHIIPSLSSKYCGYFFQKFFKVLDQPQRIRILGLFMDNNIHNLCCGTNSVHLVVSIIESIQAYNEMNIVDSQLCDRYIEYLTHPNAYRVLSKIIFRFDDNYFEHIIPHIIKNLTYYSKDFYANKTIKALLSKISKNSKLSHVFSQLIIDNLLELSSNNVSITLVVSSIFVSCLFIYVEYM